LSLFDFLLNPYHQEVTVTVKNECSLSGEMKMHYRTAVVQNAKWKVLKLYAVNHRFVVFMAMQEDT